jgi:hypothetical protein
MIVKARFHAGPHDLVVMDGRTAPSGDNNYLATHKSFQKRERMVEARNL